MRTPQMSRGKTHDRTADFLLGQIKLLRRIGDHEHRRDADRWETLIRAHAIPEETGPIAVNFATGQDTPSAATTTAAQDTR